MDIANILSSNLKLQDVKQSPTKTAIILSEFLPKAMLDGKMKAQGAIEMDKKAYKYTMNQTSATNIANSYGSETSKWIGRKISFEIGIINNKEAVIARPVIG